MRIIDPHVHIWTQNPAYPFSPEEKNPPSSEASVEMLLDLMEGRPVTDQVVPVELVVRCSTGRVTPVGPVDLRLAF